MSNIPEPEAPKNAEEPDQARAVAPEGGKVRRPFSKIAFELDTEDLAQKGVQKMMIAEVSRLESRVAVLETQEKNYHDLKTKCAVLKTKFQQYVMLEILYTLGLAAGFGIIGLLPSLNLNSGTTFYSLMGIAIVLVGISILAKWKGVRNED